MAPRNHIHRLAQILDQFSKEWLMLALLTTADQIVL